MDKTREPLGELGRDPKAAALLGDKKALGAILGSKEAQTLAGMFRKMEGRDLQAAARSAAAGDGKQLQAILAQVMADPAGARALEELRKKSDR